MNWDFISFVFSSKTRSKVLLLLSKSEKTPKQLSEELSSALSHVSRALQELEEIGLISCLTPNRRKGKFYQITKTGREILNELKNLIE